MPSSRLPGGLVWLTGLSGAGKSTLATALEARLRGRRPVELLDGDELRLYVSERLGFSREDRDRNVQRIAYIGRLLAKHGVLVLAAVISPYADTREAVKALSAEAGHAFLEIFVNAPLDTVVARDVKGLYKKALAGEIERFTGISDPYEPPLDPALELRTDLCSQHECEERILALLQSRGLLE